MIRFTPVNIDERKKIDIKSGDTVRVWQKIQEKEKTRLQVFEGLVIARKHGREPGATFTVRKIASGVGVEKIFPLYSPIIDKIEIVRRAKVRRAKLYFIREKTSKQIRRKMKALADFVPVEYKETIIDKIPESTPEGAKKDVPETEGKSQERDNAKTQKQE